MARFVVSERHFLKNDLPPLLHTQECVGTQTQTGAGGERERAEKRGRERERVGMQRLRKRETEKRFIKN